MGKIKRGILGGFAGKVANVVGSSWKGIAYMKSLPLSVANPQTAAQQTQRGKFTHVVQDGSTLLTKIVKPLWDRFAQQESGYNAFTSANIDAYDISGLATPANLAISQGTLEGSPPILISTSNGSPDVTIDWTDNSGAGNALATDECYFCFWNETQDFWGQWVTTADRASEQQVATADSDNVTSDDLHLYVAFRRADGTLVSNTLYSPSSV